MGILSLGRFPQANRPPELALWHGPLCRILHACYHELNYSAHFSICSLDQSWKTILIEK
mgnify:CR=1 FL=1